jgi:transcriptional regulator with XRE-family HTH domain
MAAGKEIKRLRIGDGNRSAQEVADLIGVKAERLRKWESRDVDPKDTGDIKALEKYFKVQITKLKDLESFQFYKPIDITSENLSDSVLLTALIRHVAKLEAKVYNSDELTCMKAIKQSARLILEERLDISSD